MKRILTATLAAIATISVATPALALAGRQAEAFYGGLGNKLSERHTEELYDGFGNKDSEGSETDPEYIGNQFR